MYIMTFIFFFQQMEKISSFLFVHFGFFLDSLSYFVHILRQTIELPDIGVMNAWPPLVIGLIGDILGNSAVGEI